MRKAHAGGAATQLFVRIKLKGGGMIGPGKAELLEHIHGLGSISAAAREMEMSYRQAWKLIDSMNCIFREPVVETSQGGSDGGGATLTAVGKQMLRRYRALQRKTARSAASDLAAIERLLAAPRRPPTRRRRAL